MHFIIILFRTCPHWHSTFLLIKLHLQQHLKFLSFRTDTILYSNSVEPSYFLTYILIKCNITTRNIGFHINYCKFQKPRHFHQCIHISSVLYVHLRLWLIVWLFSYLLNRRCHAHLALHPPPCVSQLEVTGFNSTEAANKINYY